MQSESAVTRGRLLRAELRKSVKHLSINRDVASLSPLERDSYSSPLEIDFRPTSPALHTARTGVTIARRTMKRLLSREQGGRLVGIESRCWCRFLGMR